MKNYQPVTAYLWALAIAPVLIFVPLAMVLGLLPRNKMFKNK